MRIDELLDWPGLDEKVWACLGPVSIHRVCASCKSLIDKNVLTLAGRLPQSDPGTLETLAYERLQRAEANLSVCDREILLDDLFLLTFMGQPKGHGLHKPEANLLDYAVQRNLRAVIPLLRKRGYTLELLDQYSLESLVLEDNDNEVRAYLEAGISPDIRANAGRSVLQVAVASQSRKVTLALIEWQADVNQSSGFGQWTALMWGAHVGWEEGCKLLLAANARVQDRNAQGLTAVDIARQRNHVKIEELLSSSWSCHPHRQQ